MNLFVEELKGMTARQCINEEAANFVELAFLFDLTL
jgi:hypothetical protein